MAAVGGVSRHRTSGLDAWAPRVVALPVAAVMTLAGFLGLTLAVAGGTLGYDFLAYHAAAARVLDGRPAYDLGFEAAGGFGLFYYPPTFLPLVLPFGLLTPSLATSIWIALLIAAFAAGVALMPVPRQIKWWIVLLAGLSWPFVYAVKLGQVGPLLFLTFAAGWRWIDNPGRLGASAALGTAIKLQPVVVLGWAVLTGRWRAALHGLLVLLGLAIAAVLLAGPASWTDFATLLGQLADPIRDEHNVAAGAILHRLGMPIATAQLVQVIGTAAVVTIVVVAALRATTAASYLVAVVASQLLWPVVWEHYAMLLFLPVAYLMSLGWRWAAIIPLATATALVAFTPPLVYPIAFYATMIATVAAGWRPAQARRAARPSYA